jgi:hypothetical protein
LRRSALPQPLVQPRGDALHLVQLGVGALQLPLLQVLADIAHELLQDYQARLRVGDVLPLSRTRWSCTSQLGSCAARACNR